MNLELMTLPSSVLLKVEEVLFNLDLIGVTND